ncbi:hypothetical protein [uncultured Winogradskyella sp.]|uniref:hypothetical protein n=1 Tax=uncultured Winogradskyella sp. TaxID=395353 RepID=UPI002639FFCE|nr:hypothetical protein [uncultured Winogradskyella sp.]
MKNIFIKIGAIFFLAILLTSNVLNLHIYAHQDIDNQCFIEDEHNEERNNNKDSCEICHIALSLNGLDYHFSSLPNFQNNLTVLNTYRDNDILVSPNHGIIALTNNRNKAPPYRI